MAAYSLLTIASLHVLLMTLIERRLHEGVLPQRLRNLPPLLTMEKLLFRIIWAGFILLTLTIASGVIYSEELFGKAAKFNHKTRLRRALVDHLRRPALRPASLRLARTRRGALDACGVSHAGAGLHRQQVRARSDPGRA